MFDHHGPGSIVRWWMTFAGEGSSEGIVRVYINNDSIPIIEGEVLKVLSGYYLTGEPLSSSVSPDCDYLQRGHNLYLPIPYSSACKITYECDSIKTVGSRTTPSIYYNINYRAYAKNSEVKSFSLKNLEELKDLVLQTNRKLAAIENNSDDIERAVYGIEPGEKVQYKRSFKGKAIDKIVLNITAENMAQALRSTVIEVSFDNNQTIWVPVGDFFGTGTEISPYSSFASSVSNSGEMLFSRIMPFKKGFEITITNYGEQMVECEMGVELVPYKWRKSSMYFGSSWHEYNSIKAAGSEYVGGNGEHFDINYIDIDGEGVYAGDAVYVFNTADAWWGEGDEKIYVDNEEFPSSIGTGTEDYYGYAWCRPETFSHPFIAQPRGDGNFHPGLTINLRHRALDGIPFAENISSNIELWHWVPATINYALTTWWYVKPGFVTNRQPEPELVSLKAAVKRSDIILPVADSSGIIEGENLEIMFYSGGKIETQYSSSWEWSGSSQLWWFEGDPGDTLMLRFKVDRLDRYRVKGRFSMASDYGIAEIFINNTLLSQFNGYTDGEAIVDIDLGEIYLIEGDNILSIIIKGEDPRSKGGYMFGIDRIEVTPIR
jgi:hypothetical protein